MRAGLGHRKISLWEHGESNELHHELMEIFPQLRDAGGYELLRTAEHSTKDLQVIPPPTGGYTVSFLKAVVAQAKVYIRPLQKDLCATMVHESEQV